MEWRTYFLSSLLCDSSVIPNPSCQIFSISHLELHLDLWLKLAQMPLL
uniref:Uncharacterized protein n=2 Tax=Picea TaxID=3328 RepID=A0A117NI69_PICGL|nr:hypothetical protein ABT39_MTgene4029 [Picea glauca]QHR89724.1 hypothetical protein Q903MT_gene3746 [Picea sitchensis]